MFVSIFLFLAVLCTGCAKKKKPLIVGSMSGTEQTVIGEAVAQYLEHQLPRKIERRLALGGELVTFQALVSGDISLYPDYTGALDAAILKESPSPDPAIVFERTRSELQRVQHLELLDPLGYDNPPAVVVLAADANRAKVHTLSDASQASTMWKLGVPFEFRASSSGMQTLNSYKIPLAQAVRGVEAAQLFPMLAKGELTMIVSVSVDGHLTQPEFRVLDDDKHVFPPNQACLLIREDALTGDPEVRAALSRLSGKFTRDLIRQATAEVDLNRRSPADAAADLLKRSGVRD
jgi:glycine betaine/choline ABC-type transport system substrate-binding protein